MAFTLIKNPAFFSVFVFLMVACATGNAEPVQMNSDDSQKTTLFDFTASADEPRWVAVNDDVMGGISRGGPRIDRGVLTFTGTLSLENNGGFSSVRTINWNRDLSGKQAMVLRIKGDGRTYQLRLATDARYRGSEVSYGAEFPTRAGEWTEVTVPFEDLTPSWRGRQLDGPPLDLSKVEEVGLLIGDNREGEFSLEVDWMKVE